MMLVNAIRRCLKNKNNPVPIISTLPKESISYEWLNKTLFPSILVKGGNAFRPHYTWGIMQSVNLARELNIPKVSIMEFGVAGGNGLVSMERIAEELETLYGVEIDVYGFDAGSGLPKPVDYRDIPNAYIEGTFSMDIEKLKNRLKRAKLFIGLVENTVTDFLKSDYAPVAFISIDLDYYSSTMQALRILDVGNDRLLPRIYCYLDDVMGRSSSDFNGELLAISDFNDSHSMEKISRIYGLNFLLPKPHRDNMWTEKFFMAHIFDHELYGNYDGLSSKRDLSLREEWAN